MKARNGPRSIGEDEHLTRMTWAPDRITIYSNFGVWKVFEKGEAARLNQAFLSALHVVEQQSQQLDAEGDNGNESVRTE